MYRALVNVFAYALQAMPGGGILRLQTEILNGRDGNCRLELQVQDTGHGIPEGVQKKIFNPFFTTREKGTGLGLAIVQAIVDNHNGEVELVSREGQGTSIVIRLPLVQPETDQIEDSAD